MQRCLGAMPQIEAQLAASMAMPVEFDVIQDRLGAEGETHEDQPGQDHQEQADDDGLVEQWTQSLEEPVPIWVKPFTWWRECRLAQLNRLLLQPGSSTRWREEGLVAKPSAGYAQASRST